MMDDPFFPFLWSSTFGIGKSFVLVFIPSRSVPCVSWMLLSGSERWHLLWPWPGDYPGLDQTSFWWSFHVTKNMQHGWVTKDGGEVM